MSISALCLLAVLGGDWPEWRGPARDGHAPGEQLIDVWPLEGPPVQWSRALGQGYSSFCVSGGRAWTQYQTATGQYVICLDAQTGATRWESRYALPYEPLGIYPGPRSTPTIRDGRVYFCGTGGEVGCLNADTGRVIWQVNPQQLYNGEGTGFGYSASPLVIDGRVIIPVGGPGASVVALDAATGNTAWKSGDDTASYCTVLPIALEKHRLLVAYLENVLVVLRHEDGVRLWRTTFSNGYDEHSAQPLYREPRLMIAAPFQAGARQFEFTPVLDNKGTLKSLKARETWSTRILSNDVVSSVLDGESVFGFDLRDPQSKAHRPSKGIFRCLDWQTGTERWQADKVGQCSSIVADGKLVIFNDRGELILARADPKAYREIGRAALFKNEVCWTAPALADGRLFLRTQSRALGIDLRRRSSAEPPPAATITTAQLEQQSSSGGNVDWVLGGEREHPFMLPDQDELLRWFWYSLAAIVPASLLPLAIRRGIPAPPRAMTQLFAFAMSGLMLGLAITPLANRRGPEFVLTWPAGLFAVYVLAVGNSIRLSLDQEATRWAHRQARAAGLLFVLASAVYFLALQRFSLPHEWVFLLGYVPALVVVIPLSRDLVRRGWTWRTTLLVLAGFAVFYWSCGGLELIRAEWQG